MSADRDVNGWGRGRKEKKKPDWFSEVEAMSAIDKLLNQKHWSKARALIQDELVSAPTDHWLWTTLGLTYYEERQYEKAWNAQSAPWNYSGLCLGSVGLRRDLEMCGREEAALAIWILLLDMDIDKVAYGECDEGMDWALQLPQDVHYGWDVITNGRQTRAGADLLREVCA